MPCDVKFNPTGYIALCLSENKLIQESLAFRLMQQGTSITAFSDSIVYSYNVFLGLPETRAAIAYFLERKFGNFHQLNENYVDGSIEQQKFEQQKKTIKPDHITIASGCSSLLSNLFYLLAQEKDIVLIPAPYNPSFEYDMKVIVVICGDYWDIKIDCKIIL